MGKAEKVGKMFNQRKSVSFLQPLNNKYAHTVHRTQNINTQVNE